MVVYLGIFANTDSQRRSQVFQKERIGVRSVGTGSRTFPLLLFMPPPTTVRPLTSISREAISLLTGRISMKLKSSTYEWALLKRFSRSEVKGQGHF